MINISHMLNIIRVNICTTNNSRLKLLQGHVWYILMIIIIAAIIIMIPVNNVMINILMMRSIYAHWEHNIYLWFKMSDRKMSDMIDAHSGFFQTVTSIHTMAADLTVSDKHIWLLHIFSMIHFAFCLLHI